MIAADLTAAFETLPEAWRDRLGAWSPVSPDLSWSSAFEQCPLTDPSARMIRSEPCGLSRPTARGSWCSGRTPTRQQVRADGLAFSAERSTRPSLRRIFDVLEADRPGWRRPISGRLDAWAEQGALLLNPALTVEIGRKESHLAVGWQALTI